MKSLFMLEGAGGGISVYAPTLTGTSDFPFRPAKAGDITKETVFLGPFSVYSKWEADLKAGTIKGEASYIWDVI
jgi:hypothetical protein